MSPTTSALHLLDWREQMAAAFAAARRAADPEAGHAAWCASRDALFRDHPSSPLAPGDPLRETGLPYYGYDPRYRFRVDLTPVEEDVERRVPGGADGDVVLRLVGRVALPTPVAAGLDVWSLRQYAGGLFVPLRDATAGEETYGGGRYLLDTAKGAWHGGDERSLLLDLNFAYHPSCRYDPAWQCPLAPPGNVVGARVPVGERMAQAATG